MKLSLYKSIMLSTVVKNFYLPVALIVTFVVHIRVFSGDVEKKITKREITERELQKLNKKGMILGETTVVLSVAILFFAALLDVGI